MSEPPFNARTRILHGRTVLTHPTNPVSYTHLDVYKRQILNLGPKLDPEQYAEVSPQVCVHRTATVALTACLGAPCIIGAGTEVRHCAFVRGSALVGENCVDVYKRQVHPKTC